MYGETSRWSTNPTNSIRTAGLSPRVRGNPAGLEAHHAGPGSIPACTGKPRRGVTTRCWGRVYPRVYGETRLTLTNGVAGRGLSPRVRGNLILIAPHIARQRSIPACTGKPSEHREDAAGLPVYPRVYGETSRRVEWRIATDGLSPRVRGNRMHGPCDRLRLRSIPACTGKPAAGRQYAGDGQVYPRVYGETSHCRETKTASEGLSPRVRGNLPDFEPNVDDWRSIPACTGKPATGLVCDDATEVYPRVYGETPHFPRRQYRGQGLSPRVRGNPSRMNLLAIFWGSIPACTGKPVCRPCAPFPEKVYPRVYGETERGRRHEIPDGGLSPRVRGNLVPGRAAQTVPRSIPACTGKPMDRIPNNVLCRVYPRVYGETSVVTDRGVYAGGLSPRVRGNPAFPSIRKASDRSIPACTGKPEPLRPVAAGRTVYPRVYGETASVTMACVEWMGLSPRVRGNPRRN